MKRALGVFCGVLVLTAAPAAHANPFDTFGFGSRETAMGSAAVAGAKGVSSNYYNPALLVDSKGLELSISYFYAEQNLKTNGQDNAVDPVHGFSGGIVAPGKVGSIPFAFGLALHLPDERVSRVRAQKQDEPRWELYDNRNQRLVLDANVAIAPTKWLALGGGISFMSSTKGQLDISGSATVLGNRPSLIRHEVFADLTAIRTPQFGARVKLSKRVSLGVAYRGEFKLGLDLGAHVQGDISGLTTALFDLHTSSVNNFLPAQSVLGGNFILSRNVTFAMDFAYIAWSSYVPPAAQLAVTLDIPPPAGGWPAGITPPTKPVAQTIAPLTLKDRVVPHLGLEVRAWKNDKTDVFVRGGYEMMKSPITPQRGITNYIDRTRHTGSLGGGVTFAQPFGGALSSLSVDAHMQLHVFVSDVTRKDNPADLTGDYTASGNIISAGASVTARFGQ